MTRSLLAAVALLVLAGCAATPPRPAAPASRAPALPVAGLERVMGKDARALEGLFGKPDQLLHQGSATRLQFVSPVCVLDAYLYAKEPGHAPVVTWLDARLPNGDDIDRASCVAALSRRAAAP